MVTDSRNDSITGLSRFFAIPLSVAGLAVAILNWYIMHILTSDVEDEEFDMPKFFKGAFLALVCWFGNAVVAAGAFLLSHSLSNDNEFLCTLSLFLGSASLFYYFWYEFAGTFASDFMKKPIKGQG